MNAGDHKRREAVRALMNIALLEGMVLFLVVALYLATGGLAYLVGGLVAASLIFAPLFVRWLKAHGAAFRSPDGARETDYTKAP
ncbi:MAG: hypothetical protein Kow00133_15220 [Amphiplicatus sp.]